MKPPKSEPYQRSRHRATLQAWVVAATAVAAVGLPAKAVTSQRENTYQQTLNNDQHPMQDAQSVASYWFDALLAGDTQAAMSHMRLPATQENQQAVQTDLDVLSDMLMDQDVRIEAVAHRQAGHWALSAWRMDAPGYSLAPVIEPITLYHPAADGLIDTPMDWQVVPQGMNADPALAPLYNADHGELMQWAQTLV